MPPKAAASGTQKITTFFSLKKPSTASAEKSPKKPATPSNGKSENPNKRKRESVNLELSDDSDGCASPIITRSKSTPTKSPVATSSSTPSKSTTSTTPTKSSASKATSSTSKSTPTKSTPTKSTVTLKNKSTPTKSVKDEDWSDDDRDFAKKVVNKVTPTKPPVVAQKNTKVIVDDEDDDTLSSQDVVSSPSTKKRKTSSPFSKSPKVEKVKEEKPKTTPKKEVKKEEKKKETKKKDDDDDEEKPAETKKRGFYNKAQHENKQKAKNPGCKKVPVGKSNCLKDKSFVITGQMESLDREEMEDLIKQYGGVIRLSVSGRTSFVIVGEEPGESKMKKVREHKTKQLSEDDLLEMIAKSNPSGQDSMDESDDEVDPPQKFIPPPRPNVVTSSTTQVIKSKNGDDQLWVEKYKPSSSSQIIGHNKECGLLLTWLKDWHTNLEKEIQAASAQTKGRKKATSEWKRAAFLSGPPGIGKSTSAALIAREAGYTNIVELNASDSRSKKAMKEQIVESCLSNNINNYFQKKGQKKSNDKQQTIVIMDEVDGMSSGDRGGVVELVQIIKQTRVPVICIANDRSKISLKTLITHCLDLKFSRPSKATITKKLLEVCKKENLSIDNNALEYMVESLNNDIRSVLNNLQLINRYSSKDHIGYMDAKNSDLTKTSSTDGIFDVVKDVLGQNTKKYNERLEDFYFDPMLVPLFVEQNYINIRPPGDDKERIQRISYASDAISMGDMVNSKIRKEMSFGLMNTHAFYSTMYPAYFIRGSFQPLRGYDKYYQFPAVLGKGSTTTKNYNALKTIQKTTSLKASADTLEMLDYLPLLSKTLLNPLVNGGKDVQETIEAMDEYQISRDDLEFMCELSTFKGKNLSEENKDWFSEIDTKTKTALTRQYNKAHKGFNKVSAAAALSKVEDENNIEAEEEDEEDDLKADKFVTKMKNIAKLEAFEKKRDKVEKKTTKKTTKKETTKKESTKKEVKKETEKKPLVLKKK